MKKQYNGKKIRYGSISFSLTVLFIAALILFNVGFSALANRYLWYIDMTAESLYSVSDECESLLDRDAVSAVDAAREYNKGYNLALSGAAAPAGYTEEPGEKDSQIVLGYRAAKTAMKEYDEAKKEYDENKASDPDFHGKEPVAPSKKDENAMIRIRFLDEADNLNESTYQRYIYNTALELESMFPDYIEIDCINMWKNPSAVTKYTTTATSNIASTSVIIEFGTEFRVFGLRVFYVFNSNSDDTPWAYNGEKKFAAAILAVTRAESPICYIDMAHGEVFADSNDATQVLNAEELLYTMEDAGYLIVPSTKTLTDELIDEIEETYSGEVRLMLIFNPTADFMVADPNDPEYKPEDYNDEIKALDNFLDGSNSMLVFMSPTSPYLRNFEEYLEEWGISFARSEGVGQIIKDEQNSLTAGGYTVVGEYVTTGLGQNMTEDMQKLAYPKKVIFRNTMPINVSGLYQQTTYKPENQEEPEEDTAYTYYTYYKDGVSRSIYDVFRTSASAVSMAGDHAKPIKEATADERFSLMTVSVEYRSEQESNYTSVSNNSYVIATGSTQFASQLYLQSSAYGNTDLLLTAVRTLGHETVPVGLAFKPFADTTIDTITTTEYTAWTVALTAIPALTALISAVVVLVKRKYA